MEHELAHASCQEELSVTLQVLAELSHPKGKAFCSRTCPGMQQMAQMLTRVPRFLSDWWTSFQKVWPAAELGQQTSLRLRNSCTMGKQHRFCFDNCSLPSLIVVSLSFCGNLFLGEFFIVVGFRQKRERRKKIRRLIFKDPFLCSLMANSGKREPAHNCNCCQRAPLDQRILMLTISLRGLGCVVFPFFRNSLRSIYW